MELTIDQALQRAVEAHQAGKLSEAEGLYLAILQAQPAHPDANHKLGVLTVSVGRPEMALPLFNTALKANPNVGQYWLSYVDALIKAGQIDNAWEVLKLGRSHGLAGAPVDALEASLVNVRGAQANVPLQAQVERLIACYQSGAIDEAKALALALTREAPGLALGWKALGALLQETGAMQEAVSANQRALQCDPNDADVYNNLGTALRALGRLDEAETSYRTAITLKPNYADAHGNLAIVLWDLGHLPEAEASCRHAIALKPDHADAHSTLGIVLKELGRLEEAEASYRTAIAHRPSFALAHCNLGNVLGSQGRMEEAEASYRRAIAFKPDFADAHCNLANVLGDLGRLDEAEASYRQAIAFKPDLAAAHSNLVAVQQELGRLEEAAASLQRALAMHTHARPTQSAPPVTALLPFGRSGSLFFHSLFDGHPELASLPGVYFKGWFGMGRWQQYAHDAMRPDWHARLVARLIEKHQPLFDAHSKQNVPGAPLGHSAWLAKELGFTEMGPDRSTVLRVDQRAFADAFLTLSQAHATIDAKRCFELIHRAFEIGVRNNAGAGSEDNGHIFYHIHNPDPIERATFLHHYPQARMLHLIRHPVQSLESWILSSLPEGRTLDHEHGLAAWSKVVGQVVSMFMHLRQADNARPHSRGLRLEDVKRDPRTVMPQVAAWMGVSDHPALYESRFCGLQYWGPASKTVQSITGFDAKAIDQPVGRFLGPKDVLIFDTLFWPFSRIYGYSDDEVAGFRRRLAQIRPWLDEPLEFEARLYSNLPRPARSLTDLWPYQRLHRLMHQCWSVLDREGSYQGMVQPLRLD